MVCPGDRHGESVAVKRVTSHRWLPAVLPSLIALSTRALTFHYWQRNVCRAHGTAKAEFLSVVSDDVEARTHTDFLRESQCKCLQGDLLEQPDSLAAWLGSMTPPQTGTVYCG